MATIEEKNGHVLANAEARVENENQKHCYCEDETAGHITAEFEHKGEAAPRSEKVSTVTGGRHITAKKSEFAIAKERKSHNEKSREEHQKSWDSDKKSVVPERSN